MLRAPLEQFQILQILHFHMFSFDFSITNFMLINLLSLLSILSLIYYNAFFRKLIQENNFSFFFIPNSWQKNIEILPEITAQLITDTILIDNEKYFPIVSVLFNFIFFTNLIGLLPYSFTATSHLIATFILSFSIFAGINIIAFKKYKIKIFSLFLPANATFFLALLLIPILRRGQINSII